MDKKDGGNIDLASLRGFTPGPWCIPSTAGSSGAVAHAGGYVFMSSAPATISKSGIGCIRHLGRTTDDR